ncbi:MAG: hypothetical protein IPG70_14160, partial [Moraxellaceae bacterium]|nr:hypothetical protein [Moraxellaceae bacterium]
MAIYRPGSAYRKLKLKTQEDVTTRLRGLKTVFKGFVIAENIQGLDRLLNGDF